MKGGFFGFGESTPTDSGSSIFGSISSTLTDAWDKTKKATSDAYSSATGSTTGSPTYVPPPTPPPPTTSSSGYMGGRKRSRKNRKLRGGMNPTSVLSDDKDSKRELEESQMKYTSMPNPQLMEKINKEMAIARAADDAAIEAMSKGGKKMRGGYRDNISITGLAASAAPISDIKSSQPLNIVGGRRTKRRRGGKHRHGKSCKHRRH
jgi:hypothetical protein